MRDTEGYEKLNIREEGERSGQHELNKDNVLSPGSSRRSRWIKIGVGMAFFCIAFLAYIVFSIVASGHKTSTYKYSGLTDMVILGDSWSQDRQECFKYYSSQEAQSIRASGGFPTCPANFPQDRNFYQTWTQRLKQDLQDPHATQHIGFSKELRILSLAQGGASCRKETYNGTVIDGQDQLNLYRTNFNTTPIMRKLDRPVNTTLLVVFFGTNDLDERGSSAMETNCISGLLGSAYDFGFRHFLVMRNANIDANHPNTNHRGFLRFFIKQDILLLDNLVDDLKGRWNDAIIQVFPTYALLTKMQTEWQSYGFTNASSLCNGCKDTYNHVWQNWMHPSSRTMHVLARKVERFLVFGARNSGLLNGGEGVPS